MQSAIHEFGEVVVSFIVGAVTIGLLLGMMAAFMELADNGFDYYLENVPNPWKDLLLKILTGLVVLIMLYAIYMTGQDMMGWYAQWL